MDLAALEEIRRVKYRYLRCVDLKLWEEIGQVFTPDATASYGTPAMGKPLDPAGRDSDRGKLHDRAQLYGVRRVAALRAMTKAGDASVFIPRGRRKAGTNPP